MHLSSDRPQKIAIVDDNEEARESLAWAIEDDSIEPIEQEGPLGTLSDFLSKPLDVDGALSDHKLRTTGYAMFDGADLVAGWYQRQVPAVLCTTFSSSRADLFRARRRWIPVVMSPDELNQESFQDALEFVTRELGGQFVPPRRPWRALVHFVEHDADTKSAFAVAPGWGQDTVSLRLMDLPNGLASRILAGEDVRVYAQANLGAEANDDLYFCEWESS